MTGFLDILPRIIWSGFIGLAIGNFATNPIYRLPRGESLFGRDPYCGDCNSLLKPRDLFPVFSWLCTRGKCRYCGAAVPAAYAVTEAIIGLLFVAFYLKYGFSEQFIIAAFGATAFVMLGMMLFIDNFFSDRTLVVCIMLGMLHRVLLDGTMYGFLWTAYAGLIAGVVEWKLSGKPMVRDMAAFPVSLKLLVVAGVWLNFKPLFILMLFVAVTKVVSCKLQKNGLPEAPWKWLAEWWVMAGVIIGLIIM